MHKIREIRETKILTRLKRIKLVLLKAAQGQRITQREARAALKDFVDVENLRNTPPPARTLTTLKAIIEAEERVMSRLRRGATLTEIQHICGHVRSTINRHRDSLAAHGCLTRLYPGVETWGNWVSTEYGRDNVDKWIEVRDLAKKDREERRALEAGRWGN